MNTSTQEPLVTIAHCRALGYCASGMRAFAATHGLDWNTFREQGLPASLFDATQDAMGIRAADLARQEQRAQAPNENEHG